MQEAKSSSLPAELGGRTHGVSVFQQSQPYALCLAHILPQQMPHYGDEPVSQHTLLDAAQTQCEIGVLAQSPCHFAAQQSCLQAEQLSVSGDGTDDGVQMGKKLPEASQHLVQC